MRNWELGARSVAFIFNRECTAIDHSKIIGFTP